MTISQKQDVVAAPMSFAGSLGRARNLMWHDRPVWYKAVFGWWLMPTLVLMWWMLILTWYMMFGLLLVPYRLLRRGSRKQKIQNRQHAELLEAMRNNNK